MSTSKIEWTEKTWNPITGCSKISEGCLNCYAERMAKRLQSMGQQNYRNGFEVTCHEHALEIPLNWKKSSLVFVNSMSDMFHDEVSDEFIFKIFDVMQRASQHQFQVLTKRSTRLQQLAKPLPWPKNVWIGVTVESSKHITRLDNIRDIDASIKFVSMEPLLGPIPDIDLSGIDWVIVGGESGPGSRDIQEDWVLDIRDQCNSSDTAFFFKQWGGVNKKKAGRLLENRTWDEMPKPIS